MVAHSNAFIIVFPMRSVVEVHKIHGYRKMRITCPQDEPRRRIEHREEVDK